MEIGLNSLKTQLAKKKVELVLENKKLIFSFQDKSIVYTLSKTLPVEESDFPCFRFDHLMNDFNKIAGVVFSKLGLNERIYARKCNIDSVDNFTKNDFLSKYHLMGSTQSAYNLGLFYENELVAIATFSKGRKMDRLHKDIRSFELIRFCCKHGLTVVGGLSKLVSHFCKQKSAGDIMTYVNKEFGSETAFINAGFVQANEHDPHFNMNSNSSLKKGNKRNDYYNSEKQNKEHPNYNFKLLYIPTRLVE
ncbi:hypothetical protein [Aurantibacillus circumpalustris]|uniref:hypothetical protein n=1 Tax=Aurantibacillus circumpalustris TaxID=3036359 RepID=UPI00295B4D5B|nr:hypothetical protein [Aurantibacillus circumpalustris]